MSNLPALQEKEKALNSNLERAKNVLVLMFPEISVDEIFIVEKLNSGLTGYVYTVILKQKLRVNGKEYQQGTSWVLKIPVLTEDPLGNKNALTHEIAAYKFLEHRGIAPKLIASIEDTGLLIEKVTDGIESKASGLQDSLKSGSRDEFLFKIKKLIELFQKMMEIGIIHLDLSPSNILWANEGYTLIDWAFYTAPKVPSAEENSSLILASSIEHTSAFYFLGSYAYNAAIPLVSIQSLLGDDTLYNYKIPVNVARDRPILSQQLLEINRSMANNYNVIMILLMIFGMLFKADPNQPPVSIKIVDETDNIPCSAFIDYIKNLKFRFTGNSLREEQIDQLVTFFKKLMLHFLFKNNTAESIKVKMEKKEYKELNLKEILTELFNILDMPL